MYVNDRLLTKGSVWVADSKTLNRIPSCLKPGEKFRIISNMNPIGSWDAERVSDGRKFDLFLFYTDEAHLDTASPAAHVPAVGMKYEVLMTLYGQSGEISPGAQIVLVSVHYGGLSDGFDFAIEGVTRVKEGWLTIGALVGGKSVRLIDDSACSKTLLKSAPSRDTCKCDIKELFAGRGHDAGCPEKKR